MSTYTIAGVFRPDLGSSADGLTVEGYPVSSWSGSPPSLGTTPPGSPPVSTTTSTSYGDHGAWELALPTNEDYFVVVEYSSDYYWQRCNVPTWTDGVQSELDVTTSGATGQLNADNVAIAGTTSYGVFDDPLDLYIQPVGNESSGSVGGATYAAYIDHQHDGLGQSMEIVSGLANTRYVGGTTGGEPGSPVSPWTYQAGDFAVDQTGVIWVYDGSAWQELAPPSGAGSTGDVKAFAGITPPSGWLACDGSGYSSSSYSDLFGVLTLSFTGNSHDLSTTIDGIDPSITDVLQAGWAITAPDIASGTTILTVASGSITLSAATTGSGTTGETLVAAPWGISGTSSPYTFNVPDLRGRTLVGQDPSGVVLTKFTPTLGTLDGDQTVALTEAELAQHSHSGQTGSYDVNHTHALRDGSGNWAAAGGAAAGGYDFFQLNAAQSELTAQEVPDGLSHSHTIPTDPTDTTVGHNNVQPFGAVNYIIKT